MTRCRVAPSSLLIVLCAALPVLGQEPGADDNPMGPDPAPGRAELVIEAGKPVVIDGTASEGEWDDTAVFEIRRDDDVWARGAIKRDGRDLLVHVDTISTPWAFGLKLVFIDPRGGGRCTALVTPLNPPRAPLSIFREQPEQPAEWVRTRHSDFRMQFHPQGGFEFEVKLPLDRIGIARDDRRYAFAAEIWDLSANRAIAVYPMAASGPLAGRDTTRLVPDPDWGADVPLAPEDPPAQPALALLEDLAAEESGTALDDGPVPELIEAFLGTRDGRRREAPLVEMEKRLRALIEQYPDYVSLRANLVRVLSGRNDYDAAYEELLQIDEKFPMLADDIPQVMAKVQLLVQGGRYDDALAVLDFIPAFLEEVPGAREMRASVVTLKYHAALEAGMRAQDEQEGDLPRVRVETDRGAFVVELYEDDAPNAVANFLALCRDRFYEGTRFHWVERGGRVIGGDPLSRNDDAEDDGFGHPGYRIESEVGRRLHTAGTIAFVDQRRRPRTEGCIFAIHLSDFPQLDGRNSVLGRVIEGMDVVKALEYGDAILRTEILRQRDHDYVPVKRAISDW